MFERHRQKAFFVFALLDVALTVLSFEAAYQSRLLLPLPNIFFFTVPTKALLLGFTVFVWLLVGYWLGVHYRLYGNDTRRALYDTVQQVAVGVLSLVAFQFLLKLDTSRAFIGLFAAYNLTALLAYRAAAGRLRGYIRHRFGAEQYYLIVGGGARALQLGRQLEQSRAFGTVLLSFIDVDDALGESVQLERQYPVRGVREINHLLELHVVDEILFAVGPEKLGELENIFLRCDEEGVRTRVLLDVFPHVNSDVYLDRMGHTPMLTFSATPHDEVKLFLKRAFDVACASVALMLLAVPMALTATAVILSSEGPAVFRQIRCGLNGRRFTFYKFRSMVKDAEDRRAAVEHLNQKDGPVFKASNDPRITRIGRVLRKYSIDEWPQFWNILKGDMSLVGPRPAVPGEVEQYQTWQRRRLRMRPGLTCLWAIEGRDEIDFETWMRLDLQYIDNWSFWLDLKILMHSIPQVLLGRGAN